MDVFSRLGISFSGPFSDTMDQIVRGIIKQFGLEDDLEKVSGDNEKLMETAAEYRQAARDLQGVVQDLQAERTTLLTQWSGEAADAFRAKSLAFEKALDGEAEDMDTIATLLETAAEACATAEQLMIDLIVEIIETVVTVAATTAILSLLTAGAAAAIGPLIMAAGVAQKALSLRAIEPGRKARDRVEEAGRGQEEGRGRLPYGPGPKPAARSTASRPATRPTWHSTWLTRRPNAG
ncbi:WXG100 family type VII secretion target [Streptomyces sp. CRN 30]|uniref:WXG100 family type VII secretion target n=1 Tax=Streptomyces sp. CRN 30 TaxID=3075613 RepID=UPI002A7FBFAE|nr:WXG100 family type VII secretion target [Streptomyces sp. CRN 30]